MSWGVLGMFARRLGARAFVVTLPGARYSHVAMHHDNANV
jgi:hypothetical protein